MINKIYRVLSNTFSACLMSLAQYSQVKYVKWQKMFCTLEQLDHHRKVIQALVETQLVCNSRWWLGN